VGADGRGSSSRIGSLTWLPGEQEHITEIREDQRSVVLDELRRQRKATAEAISEAVTLPVSVVRKRLAELGVRDDGGVYRAN